MKNLIVLMSCLLLSACNWFNIKTDVQKVQVPILYCPAPPKIQRPVLPIYTLTEKQKNDPGTVAKYYKASLVTLIGYTEELEKVVQHYREANQAYEQLRQQLEQELKQQFK